MLMYCVTWPCRNPQEFAKSNCQIFARLPRHASLPPLSHQLHKIHFSAKKSWVYNVYTYGISRRYLLIFTLYFLSEYIGNLFYTCIPDERWWTCFVSDWFDSPLNTSKYNSPMKIGFILIPADLYSIHYWLWKMLPKCSTTGKPTRSFATERVSLDSV